MSDQTSRRSAAILKIALAGIIAACGSDSLTLPDEGAPTRITIVAGNDQQGTAGSRLGDSLVVRITDAEGRPVVNRSIGFNLPPGGAVQPGTVNSDGEGKAVFHWVLGFTAGQQSLEVGLGSGTQLSPKVTFTALASPGPVQAINVISGDQQTAAAGSQLPQRLVVRLLDSFGNGVSGSTVTWQASEGILSETSVATGSDGSASVTWILGPTVGVQTVTARFQGAEGSPITFSATATPGASPRLGVVTQPSGTVQSGVEFAQQPTIQLETSQGDPIAQAGVTVTAAIATGGGSLGGTTSIQTSASGVAQFTDLAISGTSGARTLIFAAVGHTSAISSPVDVSAPSVSATRSTVSASPTSMTVGAQSTITVTARDDVGTPVPGMPVVILVSGSGNTLVQPAGLTDSRGIATGTLTSTTAESKTISAQIGSITIAQTATVTVTSAAPSAQHSTASVPGGKPLRWTTITITTRDASGNRLTRGGYASLIHVSVSGVNNDSNLTIFDQGDGTYEASYFPIITGTDYVAITISGAPIQGSPYQTKVK